MVRQAEQLHRRFRAGLQARKRRWLGRELIHRLPEALLLCAAAIVLLHFIVRPPWPMAAGIALITLAVGTLGPALRRYGSTVRCAREFDRRAGTNTRVLNACELLQHRQNSDFARFAIADGCAALEAGAPDADAAPYDPRTWWRRAVCAAILLVSAVLCGLLSPSAGLHGSEAALPPPASPADATDSAKTRPLPPKPAGTRALGTADGTTQAAGVIPSSSTGREIPAPPERRNIGTKAAAAARRPGVPDGEPPRENRESSEEKTSEIGGFGHSSENCNPTSPVPAALRSAFAKSVGRGERSRRAGRKRSLRLNPEAAQGGAQPMLADNAPPAGRELGAKAEEGAPDNGRSGPNGEKKARGTAAMLPVMPQPDTVNGTLSPGAEIRSKESIPPPGSVPHRSSPAAVADNGEEPLSTPEIMPLAIRKEIAHFGGMEP